MCVYVECRQIVCYVKWVRAWWVWASTWTVLGLCFRGLYSTGVLSVFLEHVKLCRMCVWSVCKVCDWNVWRVCDWSVFVCSVCLEYMDNVWLESMQEWKVCVWTVWGICLKHEQIMSMDWMQVCGEYEECLQEESVFVCRAQYFSFSNAFGILDEFNVIK